jgi:hypothetical protein
MESTKHPRLDVEKQPHHLARPGFRIAGLTINLTQKVPWHCHSNVQDTFYVLEGQIGVAAAAVRKITLAYCTQCRPPDLAGLTRRTIVRGLGEIRNRSYENQRYRASGLNLVVAAIALWDTVYLQRAIDYLRSQGVTPKPHDLVNLSPLGWEHINLTGDYHWTDDTLGPRSVPAASHALQRVGRRGLACASFRFVSSSHLI